MFFSKIIGWNNSLTKSNNFISFLILILKKSPIRVAIIGQMSVDKVMFPNNLFSSSLIRYMYTKKIKQYYSGRDPM